MWPGSPYDVEVASSHGVVSWSATHDVLVQSSLESDPLNPSQCSVPGYDKCESEPQRHPMAARGKG